MNSNYNYIKNTPRSFPQALTRNFINLIQSQIYERLYWLFWISLPTALTKRFRDPLWGPKMKGYSWAIGTKFLFAQTLAETYCSTQRVWQSDQFPPIFYAIEKILQLFFKDNKSSPNFVRKRPVADDTDGHLAYLPGDVLLDRYEIVSTLGEGTFGK